ncbi:endochitinase EP3-like [Pistacia vera]|uniref:endochitinase EP3-like n=1 Tax=Pistacia vera TaxID=55513 RepID=UPI001263D6D6|nr:endochitinase EP3-like [Pistacia vera]
MALNLRKLRLSSFVLVGIIFASAIISATSVDVGSIVTPEFFDGIKNQAAPDCPGKSFYTRDVFLNVLDQYPEFGQTGSDDDSKREIAAFFAHVTHETGSLCKIEEDNKEVYCNDPNYACIPGKSYYGRGPIQLTGNGNYKTAGDALQFDGLNSPEKVAQDPVLSFRTALWYWKTNVHSVVNNGFGATIKAINPTECGGGNAPEVQSRIQYYKEYCTKFGVDPGQNLSC